MAPIVTSSSDRNGSHHVVLGFERPAPIQRTLKQKYVMSISESKKVPESTHLVLLFGVASPLAISFSSRPFDTQPCHLRPRVGVDHSATTEMRFPINPKASGPWEANLSQGPKKGETHKASGKGVQLFRPAQRLPNTWNGGREAPFGRC